MSGIYIQTAKKNGGVTGFSIANQHGNPIGIVDKIITHGIQMLIELTYNNKVIHVPLHHELIKNIYKDTSIIQLEIAEGLLDM